MAPLISASIGLLTSAYTAGGISSYTIYAIPALLQNSPTAEVLVKTWYTAFLRGYTYPGLCMVAGISYAVAAYQQYARQREWRGYAAAAALTVSVLLFTRVLIIPTVDILAEYANGGRAAMSMAEATALVEKWNFRSAIRSALPMLGAIAGLWNMTL